MTEIMDNFVLNVRAVSFQSFERAMTIAFAAITVGRASHWCVHPKFGFVLFWRGEDGEKFHGRKIRKFPEKLDAKKAAAHVWQWLKKVDRAKFRLEGFDRLCNYGDVRCENAWRVYTDDAWGHVGGSHHGIAAVLPVWAWLGK